MNKLTRKIKEELAELLPPTIFFFVALHIVAFVRELADTGSGIDVPRSATVTLAALILAKSVLLADMLPFINRYPEKPLIWNIGWKSTVYFFVAAALHYFERLYDFWKEAPGLVAANQKMLAELVWPHFWAIQILLALLILMYCVMGEFSRVLGRDKLKAMFLGPLPVKSA